MPVANLGRLKLRLYRLLFVLPPTVAAERIISKLLGRKAKPPPAQITSEKIHPVDTMYNISTSGRISYEELQSQNKADLWNADYGPSDPSVVRRAISAIPNVEQLTFVDVGCGKGRVLAVASEYPFRDIVGVELVPSLVTAARQNIEEVHRNFPERTRIKIVEGDATSVPLPDGQIVVFMYHPFFKKMMKRMVKSLTVQLEKHPDNKIFVVYYNPVYWKLFDRSVAFERFFAEDIEFDTDGMIARNFHEDHTDPVVIWQSRHIDMAPSHANASSTVRVEQRSWRVRVLPSAGGPP